MKFCPNCQTRYSDDSLKFCLQDGTQLASAEDLTTNSTIAFNEPETIVAAKRVEPLQINIPPTESNNWQQNPSFNIPTPPSPEPKKPRTLLTVLLTAFVMLIIFGAIGAFAFFYFRSNQKEIAKNTANQNSVIKETNVNKSPTPTPSPKPVINIDSNTDTPTPTPAPIDKKQIEEDVSDRIVSWESAGKARNLNSYMNNYAPTVDYYNKGNASVSEVRKDKERAFSKYDTIDVEITNLTVTPDASGETATAVFDKEWMFENDTEYSAGKVRQQIKLKKINGNWLISGEKDLKLYYKE